MDGDSIINPIATVVLRATQEKEASVRLQLRSLRIDNFYPAAVTIALGLFIFYRTFTHFAAHGAAGGGPFRNAALYPRIIAGALIILGILLIVTSIRKKDEVESESLSSEGEDSQKTRGTLTGDKDAADAAAVHWRNRVRALSGLSILIGYVFALGHFGYYLATPVMLIIFFRILGVKSWIQTVLLSAGVTVGIILFFQSFLNVVLPVGKYGFLLG